METSPKTMLVSSGKVETARKRIFTNPLKTKAEKSAFVSTATGNPTENAI
jgi:hypothetical protein